MATLLKIFSMASKKEIFLAVISRFGLNRLAMDDLI